MAENALYPISYDLTNDQMLGKLPIRGEKKLIPIQSVDENDKPLSTYSGETLVKPTFTDYITIRLLNRVEMGGEPFVFRFLINPKTISVAHQTLDSRAMTRSGWQMGVWGEDTIDLNISGSTAGQYQDGGLTDGLEEFTISYRNTMELMNLFENNGYTFEGSDTNKGYDVPDFTRRRIKSQQDVELRVGNFIWRGMFTSMNFESTADTPYYNKFSLGFLAWKEDYTNNSPWRSPKPNAVYRGHSKDIFDIKQAAEKAKAEREAAQKELIEATARENAAAVQETATNHVTSGWGGNGYEPPGGPISMFPAGLISGVGW